MSTELKTKTLEFIKTHPQMNFDEFSKISKIKMSDRYYYMLRSEIFPRGRRVNSSFKSGKIYINLISIPSKDLSEETKKILQDVLRAINNTKGTRLEMIENIGEKILEIRQVGLK